MIIGGLDPGLNGAFALVIAKPVWVVIGVNEWDCRKSSGDRDVVKAIERSIVDLTMRVNKHEAPRVCIMEDVHSRPLQGIASTFKFGVSKGAAEGFIRNVLDWPLIKVAPAKWKRQLGLSNDKHDSIKLARLWRPEYKWRVKDHNKAEALLLTVWHAWNDAAPGKFGIMQ